MSLSIAEQLCYSTVRIESYNNEGQCFTGTGFFFDFKISEKEHIPIIVTNKHVVSEMKTACIYMTKKDENGNPINTEHFKVELDLKSFVREHPDKEVDLCAILLAPVINYASSLNVELFYILFDKNTIIGKNQNDEIDAIEEILMIGYPIGLWDSVNNMPLFRRGSSATHPNIDYEGRKEFMIDVACFPGSSGSPVLTYNPLGSTSKNGSLTLGSPRVFLLGILYAGPQFTATGEIQVVDVPTFLQPQSFSRIPMNLGYVIKAERILELEQLCK